LQILRAHHRLRLHAGRRHGQRSSDYVSPSSRGGPQGEALSVLRKLPPRLRARTAPRAWQRMLSGRRLDLLDPSPLDVEIEDIAHGLAFVARWNGQTRGEHPYSVAELYGRIAPRAEPRWRLAALLHDAPEYVIGDMISPVKGAVGPGYAAMDA